MHSFHHRTLSRVVRRTSHRQYGHSRMSVTSKISQRLREIIQRVQAVWNQGLSIARDPVKIWELSLKVILMINSYLFILPVTVGSTRDGIRTVRVPTGTCRLFMPYALNVTIAIRISHLVSITFDSHFKWLAKGQFTTDASLFVVLLLIAGGAHAIHLTFLQRRGDFVFLCNSVQKLNMTFSGRRLRSAHAFNGWDSRRM